MIAQSPFNPRGNVKVVVRIEQHHLAKRGISHDVLRHRDARHNNRRVYRKRLRQSKWASALAEAWIYGEVSQVIARGKLGRCQPMQEKHFIAQPVLPHKVRDGRISVRVARQDELVVDESLPQQVLVGLQQHDYVLVRTELTRVKKEAKRAASKALDIAIGSGSA